MSNETEKEMTTLTRDGRPPLRFHSDKDWTASNRTVSGSNQNRWTRVTIHRTAGGKYVAAVGHYTCWQGEHDHFKADVFTHPAEVIQYLTGEDGDLGRVSQECIESAAKDDPGFAAVWVQNVD